MDWTFDIRSALLVGALLTLMIGLVLLVVGRALSPAYRPSIHWWVGATLLQPAGFVLLSLRDTLSPIITIVVANAFIALGFAAYVVALRHFFRLPSGRGPLLGLVALAVAISFHWGLVQPDLTRRLIAVSVVLAVVLGLSAAIIYRHGRGAVRHVAGMAFAGAAAIMAYRAVILVFDPTLVTGVFQLTHVQLLTYAVGSVLPVIGTIGFLLLCTERSQHELERAARVDYLTGSYNRRAIEELATQSMASARRHGLPLSVLVLDIDHFKSVNDGFGHDAGDEVLAEFAVRLATNVRAVDVPCRMGGEEFVVVMPGASLEDARIVAERIRRDIASAPFRVMGGKELLTITISIGVAATTGAGDTPEALLKRADEGVYEAKAGGRNKVIAKAA